jgi:hypothetical protein
MKFILIILIIFLSCKKPDPLEVFNNLLLQNKRIEYYFSNPYDSINNDKVKKEILDVILNAKENLYIFCYELQEEDIVHAIYEQYKKGIKIKIIGSKDQTYDLLNHYKIPFEIRQDTKLQHIKMILSDYTTLFAGTGNFTKSDIYYNSNLFFKIPLPKEMGNLIIKKFYYLDYPYPIIIYSDFYKIKILQSPENGKEIQSIINNSILNAKQNISFYLYSFYDPTIMNSLVYKNENSWMISGIVDKTTLDNNPLLKEVINYINIYKENFDFQFQDNYAVNRGGKLHHKTFLIDDFLLTGSYNISINARDNNAEIFFWIEDPLNISMIKKKYRELYQYASITVPKQKTMIINDSYIDDTFCQETAGNNFYLQGKNAFLFVEYIKSASCPNRSSYSSGIVSSSSDGFFYIIGDSLKDFNSKKLHRKNPNFLGCNDVFCDPCEINDCNFIKLFNINFNTRFFILKEDLSLENPFYLWDGTKFLKIKIDSKQFIDDKYYYFFRVLNLNDTPYTNTVSSGILFYTSENQILFSCFYKTELRNNLKTFLNLMEWYNEKYLYLLNQCTKITL